MTTADARATLEDWLRFVQSETHILRESPQLLFQQASNQANSTAPALAAARRLEAGLEHRHWLRWINKPQSRSACLMTFPTRESNLFICAFSPDGSRILFGLGDDRLLLVDSTSGREMGLLAGHTSSIVRAAFSPDGSKIATCTGKFADEDLTVRLWDGKTGESTATLSGNRDYITCFAFSPDGARLATGSAYLDPIVKVWDVRTGREIVTLQHGGLGVEYCAFAPDGKQILSGGGDTVRLWDAATGAMLGTLLLPGISSAGSFGWFVADGSSIVTISREAIILWDVARAKAAAWVPRLLRSIIGPRISESLQGRLSSFAGARRTLVPRANSIPSALEFAISPSGNRMAVAAGRIVRVLDAKTGGTLGSLTGHSDNVITSAWSPDGTRIVSASSDQTLRIWHTETYRCIAIIDNRPHDIRSCEFLPSGREIVFDSQDQTLRIWDIASGECRAVLAGHSGPVDAFAVSPAGTRIVSKSLNEGKLWDATVRGEVSSLARHGGAVTSCVFSPDGLLVATAASDRTLKVWEAGTGREVSSNDLFTDQNGTFDCAIAPDMTRIVGGVRRSSMVSFERTIHAITVKLRDLAADRETVLIADDDTEPLQWYQWSPDGTLILTCHGTLRAGDVVAEVRRFNLKLWNGRTGVSIGQIGSFWRGNFRGPVARFCNDGDRLGVTDGRDVTIWSTSRLVELVRLGDHADFVKDLSWAPDDNTLVSASDDGAVKVWDAATGTLRLTLLDRGSASVRCIYAPDGRRLAFEKRDGGVKVWDALHGQEIASIPARGLYSFLPDSRHLICIDWGVQIWDIVTSRVVAEFPTGDKLTAVALDGSVERLALGGESGMVCLLELSKTLLDLTRD